LVTLLVTVAFVEFTIAVVLPMLAFALTVELAYVLFKLVLALTVELAV
jgi:hypothetical protein